MSKQPGQSGQRFRAIDEAERLKAEMKLELSKQQRTQQQSQIYRPKVAPAWLQQKPVEEVQKPLSKPLEPPKPAPREQKFRAEIVQEPFKPTIVRADTDEKLSQKHIIQDESQPFVIADFTGEEPIAEEKPAVVETVEEDEAALRREMLRKRQLAREAEQEQELERQRQAAFAKEKEEFSSSESSESSESESESEEEFRPMFVKAGQRVILKKQEQIEEEEALAELELQKRAMERKAESRQLAIEILQREEEAKEASLLSGENLPDDEDKPEDELKDLRAWKMREMQRVLRDYEERHKFQKDEEKYEQMREERENDTSKKQHWREFDKNLKTGVAAQQRRQLKEKERGEAANEKDSRSKAVGQRFYSKGAFTGYMDEDDELFKRNVQVATGEDAYRHLLPAQMQVKKYGLKGRGKYTSLADEDTTRIRDEREKRILESAKAAGSVTDARYSRDDRYRSNKYD